MVLTIPRLSTHNKEKEKKMIEELLKDIRELRNEMVQKNWPAQRLSNIILKYEMKLQENKSKYTTEELVEATNKILDE
tara:strand:+ start:5 stop:238 length:234 start_codon:yes stop_codon:yes gene_type:complete